MQQHQKFVAAPQLTQELLRVVGANDRTAVTQLVTVSWNGEAGHIPKSLGKESTCTIYVHFGLMNYSHVEKYVCLQRNLGGLPRS